MSRPPKNRVDIRLRYQLPEDSQDLLIFDYLSDLYGEFYRIEVLQMLRNYWLALALHSLESGSKFKRTDKEIQQLGKIAIHSLYSQIHLISSTLEIDSAVVLFPSLGFELAHARQAVLQQEPNSKPNISTPASTSKSTPILVIKEKTSPQAVWDDSIEK